MPNFYFAEDGNWGDHTNLVVIDEDETNEHFWESIECTTDTERSKFAEWFKNNDHELQPNSNDEFGCDLCDKWELGDLEE
jgi:hypothetical protein